jgi:hypothetical protein
LSSVSRRFCRYAHDQGVTHRRMSVDSGDLGLPVPEPFLVEVPRDWADHVPDPRNETPDFHIFRRGIGPDGGTSYYCPSRISPAAHSNANSLCRQNSARSPANLCDLLVRSLRAMPDLLPWRPRALFSAHLLFLLSQMFQPKPAAHLCDLLEIKIAVCSLCDGSGRITPPAGRRVRDAIAVDCELMNQDRHSLAQSHFQINS